MDVRGVRSDFCVSPFELLMISYSNVLVASGVIKNAVIRVQPSTCTKTFYNGHIGVSRFQLVDATDL